MAKGDESGNGLPELATSSFDVGYVCILLADFDRRFYGYTGLGLSTHSVNEEVYTGSFSLFLLSSRKA